jgi:hypothetical protein
MEEEWNIKGGQEQLKRAGISEKFWDNWGHHLRQKSESTGEGRTYGGGQEQIRIGAAVEGCGLTVENYVINAGIGPTKKNISTQCTVTDSALRDNWKKLPMHQHIR